MKLEHFEKMGFAFPEIERLTNEAFTGVEVPPVDILRKEFDTGDVYATLKDIVLADGRPATVIAAFAIVTKKFQQPFIWSIATDRRWRNKGLARNLLHEIGEAAVEQRAKSISLTVHVENVIAQIMYLQHGYRVEQVIEGYYGDKPGLFMRKNLRRA